MSKVVKEDDGDEMLCLIGKNIVWLETVYLEDLEKYYIPGDQRHAGCDKKGRISQFDDILMRKSRGTRIYN